MKIIFTILLATSLFVTTVLSASVGTEPTKTSISSSKELVFEDAIVTDAMAQFKSLSRVEKKMRLNEVKVKIKEFKANKTNAEADTNTLLLAILAVILPPLAVYLHEGTTNNKFWLSLVLSLLFWLPGVIYALIVVL